MKGMTIVVGCVLLAAVVLFVPAPDDTVADELADTPSTRFVIRYSDNMSKVYSRAAAMGKAGDFKDIEAMRQFVSKHIGDGRADAFDNTIKSAIESINGDKWNNESAYAVANDLARGFDSVHKVLSAKLEANDGI